MDENNLRMTMNLRNNFARLAESLLLEGKTEKAKKAIAKCMEVMPKKNIPYNYFLMPVAEVYYKLGMTNEANELLKEIANIYEDDLKYYFRFKGKIAESIDSEKQQAMAVMQRVGQIARMNQQENLAKELDERFKKLNSTFSAGM
jgi:tetratricopeptide (TPR) repeat protein